MWRKGNPVVTARHNDQWPPVEFHRRQFLEVRRVIALPIQGAGRAALAFDIEGMPGKP